MLTGRANIYQQIAISLKGGAWRPAGLAKLAIEIAKGGGPRDRWRALPLEPGVAVSAAGSRRRLSTLAGAWGLGLVRGSRNRLKLRRISTKRGSVTVALTDLAGTRRRLNRQLSDRRSRMVAPEPPEHTEGVGA